jgi:hypothetical protein
VSPSTLCTNCSIFCWSIGLVAMLASLLGLASCAPNVGAQQAGVSNVSRDLLERLVRRYPCAIRRRSG